MTLVLLPTKKTSLHQDYLCLLFYIHVTDFPTVVRLLFLQLRSTIKPLRHQAYKGSKMIFALR